MIKPVRAITAVNSQPSSTAGAASVSPAVAAGGASGTSQQAPVAAADPVLCGHCGRTASNGLVCIGMCVADSGY